MDKAEQFLLNHFHDLDQQAYYRNIVTFSNFLNLNERSTLQERMGEMTSHISFFGGYELAERQIAIFQSDALMFSYEPPIVCISMVPIAKKFADKLTHRDILGALMHSGIERDQLGDILASEDGYYIMATETIAPYLLENISKVKHTMVKCQQVDLQDFQYNPTFKTVTSTIASNRLDTFTADACKLSRAQTAEYIRSDKVFINGKLCNNVNQKLNTGDVLSFRGIGKVVFDEILGITKKDKLRVRYRWYQ